MNDEKDILKQLIVRALREFEDVKAEAEEYHKKFLKEESKRSHLEAQLKQLKQVSLLAVAEYETLHKQYLDELKYKEEITSKLKEFHNGIPQGTKGELEVLRAMRDGLNEELRNTKNELTKVKAELESECDKHTVTARRLTTAGDQMRQLNRVSSLALGEFTNLKKKFEIESDFRQKAEEAALDLVEEKKVTEDKLRILEEQNQKDEKIKALLSQIDELHEASEKERKGNAAKIKEQEEEIKNLTETSNLEALEEKLSVVLDQLDIAQERLIEAEERATKSDSEVRTLYTRLALTEKEVQNKSMVPPPPPPPPPPLAGPVLRKFITKISGGSKKKKLHSDLKNDDPQAKAMEDVVNKIKEGVKLRSVASPIKSHVVNQKEDSAMEELAGLLSTLRKGTRPSCDIDGQEDGNTSPFGARRTLKRPNLKDHGNSMEDVGDGPSNELRQKLLKQKSIAEGLEINTDEKGMNLCNIILEETLEMDGRKQLDNSADKEEESNVANSMEPNLEDSRGAKLSYNDPDDISSLIVISNDGVQTSNAT